MMDFITGFCSMCCKAVYKAVCHLDLTSWKPLAKIIQSTTDAFPLSYKMQESLHVCNVIVLIFRKEVNEPLGKKLMHSHHFLVFFFNF